MNSSHNIPSNDSMLRRFSLVRGLRCASALYHANDVVSLDSGRVKHKEISALILMFRRTEHDVFITI